MARQYKTARGKKFNMQEFSDARNNVTAVGNMSVNAKGDVLGQGGHIMHKREEMVREYYHEPPPQETFVSLKKETSDLATKPLESTETFISPEEAIQILVDQQRGTKKKGKKLTRGGRLYAASEEEDAQEEIKQKKDNNDSI